VLDTEPRAAALERGATVHSDFRAVSLEGPERYDHTALEDLLEALPERVFRAKGIVRGEDGTWASFHAVGGRVEFEPDAAPPLHGQSRLAFFGRGLTRAEVEAMVSSCRSEAR
jgi:G3E family GTPase